MDISIGLSIWLSLLLLVSLVLLLNKKRHNKQLDLPPGPPKLPVIGNLHQLGHLPHRSLWQLSKIYGSVMLLHLGSVPTLVVSTADAAKEILKTHDLDCCSRPPMAGTGRLSYNYLDIAFSPYGDYWREIRKICVVKLLNVSRVQSFRFIREEEVALLIDSITHSTSSSSPVDLSEKLFSFTANLICRIGFGKSFRGTELDNNRFEDLIHDSTAMLGSFSASDFFPYVGWIVDRLTGFHGRLEKCFHEFDTFYQQVIDHHLDPKRVTEDKEDIIDTLLKIKSEETEIGSSLQLSHCHIKAILMNIFLAGVDTGAITIIWAMAELVRNNILMKKAQEEIRKSVGNKGRVEEMDLEQLQYLKMIVKETLRLHPPAVLLIPRETMNPFKLNGYNIYPRTRVQVNAWAIGRDPNVWENPEEFYPERFIDNTVDFKGQHFEFLPFGGGRRGCPGLTFAVATVELSLANLLYSFDWKLPMGMKEEDISVEECFGLTIYKKIPLKLVPVKYM